MTISTPRSAFQRRQSIVRRAVRDAGRRRADRGRARQLCNTALGGTSDSPSTALIAQTILHFLVGSESSRRPGDSVLRLLEHSGLMTRTGKRYDITARGFQFLLEEVNTQLWDLLLQYIGLAEREGKDPVDVLGFYFMLGSLTLGQDYAVEHLTETQQACVDDLVALGLIYQYAVRPSAQRQR